MFHVKLFKIITSFLDLTPCIISVGGLVMILGVRYTFLSILSLILPFCLWAGDLQFTTYSMSISRLDLELALFDYEVKHERASSQGPPNLYTLNIIFCS